MAGTTNITFKPRSEASKAQWYVLQHLHNISNAVSLSFSWSLNSLWHSSWVVLVMQRISHLECLKLEAIWPCVTLHTTMMTKMLHLRSPFTSTCSFPKWKRQEKGCYWAPDTCEGMPFEVPRLLLLFLTYIILFICFAVFLLLLHADSKVKGHADYHIIGVDVWCVSDSDEAWRKARGKWSTTA